MVKELQSIFLSKDMLVEMRTIPPYFPLPPPLRGAARSHGNLAGLKGTSNDTIAVEECIPQRIQWEPKQIVVAHYGLVPQHLQSFLSQPLKKIEAS